MSEVEPQRKHSIPIFGILLLFVGLVLLLQNFDVLPWGLWGILWRFWPVLFIIGGISILLRHWNPWLTTILLLALLGACLGTAAWQYGVPPSAEGVMESYSEPLGNYEHAQVETEFIMGGLNLSDLPPGSRNLVEVNSTASNGSEGIKADLYSTGREGRLQLSRNQDDWQSWIAPNNRWAVELAREIPLAVGVKSTFSSTDINLRELQVAKLWADVDFGNCILVMPSSAGTTSADISAAFANLEITIPDGVAARLKVSAGLSLFHVDENRFTRQDDYYISRDFESAEDRVDMELECAFCRVKVR